jgi:uncharacterized protein (TIGR03067 family)
MRLLLGCVLCVSVPAAAAAGPADGDLKKLQGEWDLVSIVHDGKRQEKKYKGRDWKFEGHKVLYADGDKNTYDTFELDAAKSPKRMALVSHRPDAKPMPFKAIYKFEGKGLIVCVDPTGRAFPGSFESAPGSGLRLITLVRSKAK